MTKIIKTAIAVILTVVMTAGLCACSAAGSDGAQTGKYTGELIDAQNNRLVVRSADETILFVTTSSTTYDLKEEEAYISIGDTVDVTYHKGDDVLVANGVSIKQHEGRALPFGGVVTELGKSYLTVQSESLTAVFRYNEDTRCSGDLTEGDAVTVGYTGNLSADPKAHSIIVIQEKKASKDKSMHGTIAEVDDGSIIVSIDSANAYRVVITPDTEINSEDKTLKVGDEILLVYRGSALEAPEVSTVTVLGHLKYYIMDGVIDKVKPESILVKTGYRTYEFKITNDTKIQNRKNMESGHKTTITYTGEPDQDPVAISIFCSAGTYTKKEKAAFDKIKKADDKKKAEQAAAEEKEAAAKKGGEKAEADPQKEQSNAEGSSGETKTEEPAKAEETSASEENPEGTEKPESTKEENGETDQKDTAAEAAPESSGTDVTNPTGDIEVTEEPKTDEDAFEENTGDETLKADPHSVLIKAEGEIKTWEAMSKIKIFGGATLNLDIKKAVVTGGYIPRPEDKVLIYYDKDAMKLLSIQLLYRDPDEKIINRDGELPAPEPAAEAPSEEVKPAEETKTE